MVQKNKKSSRLSSNRKKRLALLIIILLLVCAGVVYASSNDEKKNSTNNTGASASQDQDSETSEVNLDPPTDEQINAARDNPTTSQSQNTNDGKKAVTPIITSYTKQEVRAFVDGIVEDNGTCTAIYAHGPDVIKATSKGISDVSHTTCGPMTLTGPVNIQGDWSVVVTYNSGTAYGKSEAKGFKVP